MSLGCVILLLLHMVNDGIEWGVGLKLFSILCLKQIINVINFELGWPEYGLFLVAYALFSVVKSL